MLLIVIVTYAYNFTKFHFYISIGRPFRQLTVTDSNRLIVSSLDEIHVYHPSNLDSPAANIQPGPNVWGIDTQTDGSFVFGDTKNKKIYRIQEGKSPTLIAKKVREKYD